MTENAEAIIKDALSAILVLSEEEPLQQADAQLAIRTMNRMVAAWTIDGINLGYTDIEDLNDDITINVGLYEPLINNLAVALYPKFHKTSIPQIIVAAAVDGLKKIEQYAVEVDEADFSNNLPKGSGIDLPDYTQDRFYPSTDENVIGAETNGSIAQETDTYDEVNP